MKSYSILIFLLAFLGQASIRVSVATYNLENLFDTLDDPLTQDETFLPLDKKQNEAHRKRCKSLSHFGGRLWDCLFLDWNEQRLNAKMKNLAEQIFKVPGSRGPDILILTEVENRQVLDSFNRKYLARAGYQIFHADSPDERGIDQAILSRLPSRSPDTRYHSISMEKSRKRSKKKTLKELRGILQASFQVAAMPLHVLALHLPSQGASFAEREAVLKELNKIALSIPANEIILAGGDFNISAAEWKKEKVYPSYFKDIWTLAHMEGCSSCLGTYYYAKKKEWSFFDLLLLRFDREKKARWRWDAGSVQVVGVQKKKAAERFDPVSLTGSSDHYPLFAELLLENGK